MKKRLVAPGLVVALLLTMFALNCLEAVRGSLAAPPFQSERPGGQAADQGIDADRKSFSQTSHMGNSLRTLKIL